MPAPSTDLVRRAVAAHLATVSAWELLSRYATSQDQEAFAGLVHRFGPLVFGVCRRILGHSADAEDAFQAVFVALSRRAGSFRDARALPAWLHRVAVRTAYKALARRRAVPSTVTGPAEPIDPADPFAGVTWREVRRVLDEEIDSLPAKLRGPVVLCWLDGLTQDEAAGRLGLSLNTLKRHLGAGRDLLRSRLTRRGLAPALAAAAVLDPAGLCSAVPDALITLAVEVGLRGIAVAPRVESLLSLPATAPTRRAVLAALLFGGAAATGGIVYALTPQRRPGEPEPSAEPRSKMGSLRFSRGPAIPFGAGSLLFTRDSKTLITGGGRTIKLWNVATGTEEGDLLREWARQNNGFGVSKFAMGPDGKRLVMMSGDLGGYLLLDTANGSVCSVDFDGMPIGVTDTFALSPDGKTLAMGFMGRAVFLVNASKLWSSPWPAPADRQVIRLSKSDYLTTLPLGTALNLPPLFSPDGTTLVTPHKLGFCLWDVKSWREKATLTIWKDNLYGAGAFSPDGRYLALGGSAAVPCGYELKVWDLAAGTELVLATDKSFSLGPLAFHPDRRTLLGARDEILTQWDVATGENRGTLTGNGGRIHALAFSPDGTLLASASDGVDGDGKNKLPPTIQIWKVARTE